MPDILNADGLQVATVAEIEATLTTGMQAIYGADINVASNSPDGQLIGILAQAGEDLRELILQVYNSMSIERSFGTQLDQRVALNGVARNQGTFTTTPVSITVTQALTIYGLDQTLQPVFTVQDSAGNQWELVTTHVFGAPGTASLIFQAALLGAVQVTANTINQQSTVVIGVSTVNNPTTAGTVTGSDEESDVQLKIRHDKMFYLASTGPAASVSAALLAIPGILDAYVVENFTNGTVNTVPAHTIWCIVNAGTATDAEIGQAIYSKKGPGCGLKGAHTFVVNRPHSNSFTAQWDDAVAQPLYVRFGLVPRVTGASFDNASIKNQLAAALVYHLGDQATIGDVVAAMLQIAPDGYLVSVGVSTDNSNFFDAVTTTDAKHYFTVSAGNITIS